MTRINCGVLPRELPDKLLLAELREIKRLPNIIGKANMENIPEEFTLNTGHVKFFYPYGAYTLKRYKSLREEALNRGFNVQDFSEAWNKYPPELMGDYDERPRDRSLIIERIESKGFSLLNGREQNT